MLSLNLPQNLGKIYKRPIALVNNLFQKSFCSYKRFCNMKACYYSSILKITAALQNTVQTIPFL